MKTKPASRRIEQIVIGKRSRTVFSGIESLAESIKSRGLLQPIGIREDNTLVCGQRRILACKMLGMAEIPVHVCDGLEDELRLLEAERDENTEREPLTPADAEALARQLTSRYAKESKAAQKEGGKTGGKAAGKGRKKNRVSGSSAKPKQDDTKRTATRAAKSTGYSEKTLRKVKEVKEAAKARPKLYGKFLKALNEKDCKVDHVYRKYQDAQREADTRQKATAARKSNRAITKALVETADFRDWLPKQKGVKAIVVDPPYSKDDLSLYGELASAAQSVVAAGSVMAVLCGQSYIPQILTAMCEYVTYSWTFAYLTPGGQAVQIWTRKVSTFWKPVLIFGKLSQWSGDVVRSDVNDNDKRWHKWGQSVSGMADLISRLTKPGDLIVDPMSGAGTTGVAAIGCDRKFSGCDIDSKSVAKANDRIDLIRSEMR